jgi:sulfite reductase (NADPH) hemoprotein beta-component
VADAVEAVLDTYQSERQEGETFIATLRRVGLDPFKQAANQARHDSATRTE